MVAAKERMVAAAVVNDEPQLASTFANPTVKVNTTGLNYPTLARTVSTPLIGKCRERVEPEPSGQV